MSEGAKLLLYDRRYSYRCRIRRYCIYYRLKIKRREAASQWENTQVINELTLEEKCEMVDRCSLKLTGFPNQYWLEAIYYLQNNYRSFHGNFSYCLEKNIIKSMVEVFKPEFAHIKWRSLVAQLLSNILHALHEDTTLIRKIIPYDFLKNVCRIMEEINYFSDEMHDYLILVGNVAGSCMTARNHVVQSGFIKIVQHLFYIAKNEKEAEETMWVISNLIKCDDYYADDEMKHHYGMTSVFLYNLATALKSSCEAVYPHALHSLYFMSIGSSIKVKIANIMHCFGLKYKLLELLTYHTKDIRSMTARVILQLAASISNKAHFRMLIQFGLLDQLARWLSMGNYTRRDQCTFLYILYNLILEDAEARSDIIMHKVIMNFVSMFIHKSEEKIVRKAALEVFAAIFSFTAYNQVKYVMDTRPEIVMRLVENLQDEHESPYILIQSLKCINYLITTYNDVYTPQEHNRIVALLDSNFNFYNTVLNRLSNHPNRKVSHCSYELLNLYGQSYGLSI